MLGQQGIADAGNDSTLVGVGIARGVDNHVAFGVQTEGTVVEVRRSDAEHVVVHYGHLGMDIDRLTASRTRMVQAQAAMHVALLQSRSEEHTSELQSLMRISYAVFCLNKKTYSSNH